MNTIAVAVYRRPEFLHLLLERFAVQPNLKKYKVHFFMEHQYHPDALKVIEAFQASWPTLQTELSFRHERKHPFLASFNILDSYREACQSADDYVILAEEDILPSRDFLRFHDVCYEKFIQGKPRVWGVCHKRRHETEVEGNPSIVVGDNHVTSLSLVTVKAIKEYLLEHLCDEYFKSPQDYAKRVFPKSRYAPDHHMDHDGQLERIMEKNRLFCIRADQARTMHAGFYGGNEHYYNLKKRGEEFEGENYLVKARQIKEILTDTGAMRDRMSEYQEQVVSIDLDGYEWTDLTLDLDRKLAKGSPWFQDETNTFRNYWLNA